MNTIKKTPILLILIVSFLSKSYGEVNLNREKYPLTPSGVFVKVDTSNYNIEQVFKYFFGQQYDKKNKWYRGFDSRKSNNIRIVFVKQGIIITNSNFTEDFLVKGNKKLIQKVYNFFNKPKYIFAFMYYDSGDSYGYRLVVKGKTKRYRFSLSTDWVTKEFGMPLEPELKILSSTFFYETEEKENLLYQLKNEKFIRSYHFINAHLASEVMKYLFGFSFSEDIESDSCYFVLKEKT